MSSRLSQLEHSILELGTEMFRLKHQVSDLQGFNKQFLKTMHGLKTVLDEKGVITSDDFDAAVALNDITNLFNSRADSGGDEDTNELKKSSH